MPDTFSYTQYILILIIIITAYTFRGITGFGSGLISIPLLALFLPLTFVVPFISFVDLVASVIHSLHTRQHIAWKTITRALPYTFIGVVLALVIFKTVNTLILVKALGIFIIIFALYSLIAPQIKENKSPVWPVFGGFFGGFIGTLFGTNGPFYVIYFQLCALDKSTFRATCAAVFLLDGLIRVSGFIVSGFYDQALLINIAYAIPIMLIAMFIGEHIHTSISQRSFQRAIGILLLLSGTTLLFKN